MLILQVGEKHLVGILILVFVKEMHTKNIKEVYGATVGVGLMGMAGNKGGASIRFKFYDSQLCFGELVGEKKNMHGYIFLKHPLPPSPPIFPVCAHLAAHRENVEGRNSDFANIIAKTVFVDKATLGGDGTGASGLDANAEMRK